MSENTHPDVKAPFWTCKSLAEMSPQEWESLCDGCGKCCLIRLEDDETQQVYTTDVHCRLFDTHTCRCTNYENRKQFVPDCVILKPTTISALKWMPRTCAYRLLSEGKPLPDWHPLVTGDPGSVHKAGMSVKEATESETELSDDDLLSRITVWPGEPEWDQMG